MLPERTGINFWMISLVAIASIAFAYFFLGSGTGAPAASNTATSSSQLSSSTQQFVQQNVDLAKWLAKEYPAQQ